MLGAGAHATRAARPHFHVVFTLPAEVRPLVDHKRERLLTLLFETIAPTLLDIARDPKHLRAPVGVPGGGDTSPSRRNGQRQVCV
jgi:hypothetical protein